MGTGVSACICPYCCQAEAISSTQFFLVSRDEKGTSMHRVPMIAAPPGMVWNDDDIPLEPGNLALTNASYRRVTMSIDGPHTWSLGLEWRGVPVDGYAPASTLHAVGNTFFIGAATFKPLADRPGMLELSTVYCERDPRP